MAISDGPSSARNDDKPQRVDTELLQHATDWMLRLEASPGDPRLRCELDAWLAADNHHQQAWEKVQGTWDLLGEMPVDNRHWPADSSARARPGRVPAFAAMAVAAVVVLTALPLVLSGWQADYQTGVAETRTTELSDGTRVVLGANSALDEDFDGAQRRVRLVRGEVFFEVAEGSRPFVVEAGDLETRDIGTAFNVREGSQLYTVAVSDGEIAVDYREGSSHRLLPGEQLTVDRDTGAVRRYALPSDRVAGWRKGRLFVQDRTVTDLVDTLERYTSGYIIIADNDLASRRVTGSYDLLDVDGALGAIVQPHGGRILRLSPFLRIVLGPA